MSDIIRLLPDSVANQIAAGEVIQRPASVIKELVENAIDAGATSIEIVLKDAGRTLIQVIDNGSGMSETDARLSFERHATSKIQKADDLFALHTMGFRGEALASIAAIAQVELRTRKADAPMGTHICISASQCESQEPDFCPVGSNFMIKNIFFNVPARRKFLKSNSVELSNIVREFEKLALVNYETEFKLSNNGSLMYQLMRGDSFKQRIVSLFAKSLSQQMIPIEAETSVVRIFGFVTRPENARKRNYLQYFFVNGRHMRHPYFHKAIMQCFDQLIPADEQPNYFLHFVVDPETIDVNIHPTKSEIKFENEQVIWQILFAAVKETLGKFSAVPTIEFDTEGDIEIPVGKSDDLSMPQIEIDPTYNPFTPSKSNASASTSTLRQSAIGGGQSTAPRHRIVDSQLNNWDALYQNFEQKRNESLQHVIATSSIGNDNTPAQEQPTSIGTLHDATDFSSGSYTQLKNKYILVPSTNGLMLIDQHRAHIRVLFDKLIVTAETSAVESQKVMFQEVIKLSTAQNLILDELKPEMEKMGFELSFLGDCSWAVNAIPAYLDNVDVKELILDVVDSAINGGLSVAKRVTERIALSSARAAAIGYGRKLTGSETDSLLASLFKSKEASFTPDGKKIITTLTFDEINKMFS